MSSLSARPTLLVHDSLPLRSFQLSKDKDVRLGSWARISSSAGGRGRAVTAMTRDIEYSHPVKTRFPGMPSHAKTYKKQEYAYDSRKGVLELEEHLRFEGIPKADHFTGGRLFARACGCGCACLDLLLGQRNQLCDLGGVMAVKSCLIVVASLRCSLLRPIEDPLRHWGGGGSERHLMLNGDC